MKNYLLTLAFMGISLGLINQSCNTPEEKVIKAGEEVTDDREKLSESTRKYNEEITNYRITIAEEVAANYKLITDYNNRIAVSKIMVDADTQKKIAELEKRNAYMKKKIDSYNYEGAEKWKDFKSEFHYDMEQLKRSFIEITTDNVK
ncbi:MAG: hypothetical protein IM638_02120 [Bacteroidetes bacterium]|nr:hypothetical protein [Bacteroidota bacterium]